MCGYLKVAVDRHNRHEADTGRAVGEHQEEVNPAQAVTENPVTPEQGIDPQWQAHQHEEVGDDKVEEEQRIGIPAFELPAEDPKGNDIS